MMLMLGLKKMIIERMGEELVTKKVADRYLKREVLGEGTYGVVFKAIDTKVPISINVYLLVSRQLSFSTILYLRKGTGIADRS